MFAALRIPLGVCAAALLYLVAADYTQAQQVQQPVKPAPQIDQPPGQPLSDPNMPDRPRREGQPTTTYFRGPGVAGTAATNPVRSVDEFLANCLLIKNQAEIDANEFALQHAESNELKQLARKMIEDQRQLSQKLNSVAKGANATGAGQSPAAGVPAINSTSNELQRLVEIDREITNRCWQMARAKLAQKAGAEFDQCFVGAQIGNQLHMLAALDVISQQAGGELQQIARETKPKVDEHLKQVEALADQLKSDTGSPDRRQARIER